LLQSTVRFYKGVCFAAIVFSGLLGGNMICSKAKLGWGLKKSSHKYFDISQRICIIENRKETLLPKGAIPKSQTSRNHTKTNNMNYYFKVLQNYANFNGRARRSEYWYFVLFNVIFSFVIGFISGLIGVEILGTVYTFAVLLPSIAVAVRRMHDVGKSGWFILIPIYNLVLAVTEGTKGENEYGPDPKAVEV
jgi:uncharacterized membrane protein YhaH (DUF805 family)